MVVVLDLDSTSDPTHGQQPLAFFHGHYGLSMYCALAARQRRQQSLRHAAAGASGTCDQDAVSGRAGRRARRQRLLHPTPARSARSARPRALFTAFRYRAKRWSRPRYVVAKAEQLGDKSNPRFVLTTLEHVPPRFLYENGYCGRGDAENRIKDFKNALVGDRLSCTTYVANAFRLLLHAFAYRLLDALRTEVAVCAPTLGRAQFDTLRLRLLKTAALVRTSVRRIAVALPATFPLASIFARVAARLGARERRTPPSEGGALALAG